MMAPQRSPSTDPTVAMLLNNRDDARKSQKKKNGNNAAGLLLRGLGSMFRFGKHRKSTPSSPESSTGHQIVDDAAIISASIQQQQQQHHQDRRSSGSATGRLSEVDRHNILRRTLPPDERDRAELGRQMAMAVARQVRDSFSLSFFFYLTRLQFLLSLLQYLRPPRRESFFLLLFASSSSSIKKVA